MFNAIVLAAGLSTRMGARNKLTLSLQDKTIISTVVHNLSQSTVCLLYTSPSPRDLSTPRMPSSA